MHCFVIDLTGVRWSPPCKECGLTSSLICFTEGNWRFESHFCETKNVSSTDGQLTICIAKRLRMWLTKMAGTRDPPERCQRPSSESAPTTMLPIPTATPNMDRPADTMVCFHRTTTEALRRARSASDKTQLNYKGRTNCYKVIISWEKNPLNLWILRLFWRKLLCRLSESWNLRSV